MNQAFEFYETPHAFTRYLLTVVPLTGRVFEPTVGSGAIITASEQAPRGDARQWVTNDLDRRWDADHHARADTAALWSQVGAIDWTVGNPPFTAAIDIIRHALAHSRVGVAMHLRASIHEVLKTGVRRTFMATHPPTGILWLPRFAYQRSPTTGKWTTDNVGACWVIWLQSPVSQFIDYAPEAVLDALEAETPAYRRRMDDVMAWRGAGEAHAAAGA